MDYWIRRTILETLEARKHNLRVSMSSAYRNHNEVDYAEAASELRDIDDAIRYVRRIVPEDEHLQVVHHLSKT